MKVNFNILMILFIVVNFINLRSYCQYNSITNNVFEEAITNIKIENYENNQVTKDISCAENMFWAINASQNLVQFTISGSSVICDGIIMNNVPGKSIAICDNINDSISMSTFYTSNTSNSTISYYIDSSWQSVTVSSQFCVTNAAGFSNYLYLECGDPFEYYNNKILRYDGISLTNIYTCDQNTYLSGADISVDFNGNIWCLTGPDIMQSQHLNVLSPNGQLIKSYNLILNTTELYGSFILNNTLYFGFGNSNPVYPNSILPITFFIDSAIVGTPLHLPSDNWYDLASCNVGIILNTNIVTDSNTFKVSPNPTQDDFVLEISSSFLKNNLNIISIYDVYGKLVLKQNLNYEKTDIKIRNLMNGIYFLRINNNESFKIIKIIKE